MGRGEEDGGEAGKEREGGGEGGEKEGREGSLYIPRA